MKIRPQERGSALITTMSMMGIILFMITGLFLYVQMSRNRATIEARSLPRTYCADTGLQLARRYFGQNRPNWNTYLSTPSTYNPIASSFNTTPAVPTSTALQTSNPELFADLDGDGKPDVYIYVRDNADELVSAPNWTRDNDLQVYVGAICISTSLGLRLQNGAVDKSSVSAEGLLSTNGVDPGYAQRCQSLGNCDQNAM